MAREGSETAAQREGSLWRDKPVRVESTSREKVLLYSPMFARRSQAGLQRDSAGDCRLVAVERVVDPTSPFTALPATVGDTRDSKLVVFQTPSRCAADPDLGAFFAPNLHIQTRQKWGGLSAGVE